MFITSVFCQFKKVSSRYKHFLFRSFGVLNNAKTNHDKHDKRFLFDTEVLEEEVDHFNVWIGF